MASNSPRNDGPIIPGDERLKESGSERKWNTLDDKYVLPADEEEFSRLDRQHMAVKTALGLYPFPEVVEPLLKSSEGGPKRILDVGCGSAAWTLDMAKLYPEVSILGIDLSPPRHDPAKFPPNVTFKKQNVNEDISEHYDQFDLIHMRFLGPFLEIDETYIKLERCLKPGGAFITVDSTLEFETENWGSVRMKRIEGDEEKSGLSKGGSWLRRMSWELGEATTLLYGIDKDRYRSYKYQGFWDHPLLDPDTAIHSWVCVPIGPWAKTENAEETQVLQTAGDFMRQSISNIHRAWHTAFRRAGLSQETLDEWSNGIQKELDEMSIHHSLRLLINYARRRARDGQPAPPLPTSPTEQVANNPQRIINALQSPWYDTFHSAEEVAAAREERREASIGELGTSASKRVFRAKAEQERDVEI